MFRHRAGRLIRLSLIVLAVQVTVSSCVRGDVIATIAPHLGQTTECVEPMPLAQDAKDWLASNPKPAPTSWFAWEDYQAEKVTPKLLKDCE